MNDVAKTRRLQVLIGATAPETRIFDAETGEDISNDLVQVGVFVRADQRDPIVEVTRRVPTGDDSNPMAEVKEFAKLSSIHYDEPAQPEITPEAEVSVSVDEPPMPADGDDGLQVPEQDRR